MKTPPSKKILFSDLTVNKDQSRRNQTSAVKSCELETVRRRRDSLDRVVQLGLGVCLKERADFESEFLLDGGEYKKGSLIALLVTVIVRFGLGETTASAVANATAGLDENGDSERE
ncbi:hypothetical protein VIGAN_01347800 [Vigna angularis var. angularis]|uniref:Uncharacterized protein n=1 Tax=Vigna angularis var. angularis TaxID=157739 RepID=A0A0S3R4U5_PHAAN|nr:hypothetical protein VIGAN_01347800 [Vigna angularis var. angularis]